MREFGYARGDQPGLDDVARTDLLLDALAVRAGVDLGDADDDALAALLGEWRDDLRWPPASALVSRHQAEDALIAGLGERRRARRGLAAIGSVAASLLLLSGLGAVVADARPGDALYGLHRMMFNEPRVNDDQILLSAKADLAKVEQMIAQGQWVQAQTQLAEVSSTLQAMNDGSRRQGLLDEVNQLNTKVEKRDPNAKLPPNSPPNPELVVPGEGPDSSWTPLAPETEPVPPASASDEPSAPGTPVPTPTPTSTPPSATTSTSTSTSTPTTTTTKKPKPSSSSPAPTKVPQGRAPGPAPATGQPVPATTNPGA